MARRRKITRREIKEDKFILFVYAAGDYITHHVQEILIGVGVVAAAAIAGVLFANARQSADDDAVRLLAPAQTAMQNNRAEDAIPIYERILDEFSSSSSAQEAALGLANAYFHSGNTVEAKRYFQEYISNYSAGVLSDLWGGSSYTQDTVIASAKAGIAACMEQEGEYASAATEYRRIAEENPTLFITPQMLLDAARCYQAAEQTAEAKSMYDQVISQYEDSRYARDARTALTTL